MADDCGDEDDEVRPLDVTLSDRCELATTVDGRVRRGQQ